MAVPTLFGDGFLVLLGRLLFANDSCLEALVTDRLRKAGKSLCANASWSLEALVVERLSPMGDYTRHAMVLQMHH